MARFSSKDFLKSEKVSPVVEDVVAGLAVIALGLGLVHEKALDILGDHRKVVSEKEAKERALHDYQMAFEKATPYGKFALQYTEITDIAINYREGGTGPLSWFASDTTEDYLVRINNNCLSGTPYDRSSTIVVNPASRPDTITISPAQHSHEANLVLHGVASGDELTPGDRQTEEILETYGCEPADNSVTMTRMRADFANSSPVILETR